jgi:DNA topoisomerase I
MGRYCAFVSIWWKCLDVYRRYDCCILTIRVKMVATSLNRIAKSPHALVVCEKPSAALRIARVLGTSSFEKLSGLATKRGRTRLLFPVYSVTFKNDLHFVVCSSIGHLYGLVDVKGNRSIYPIFDVKWMPILKKRDGTNSNIAPKSELIIKAISLLSQNATSFINACDYDQEGEVIGHNILEYACSHKYAKSLRAKFSTLTDDEIRNSFDNLLQPSTRLAEAGRSRHMIDFMYGVNLSRALTQSFKVSNDGKRYYNLSMGRVQGPTLAFVVDREIDIRKHIPVPYWTIAAQFAKNGHIIKTHYYMQKIDTLSEASFIVDACKNQDGKVTEIRHHKAIFKAPNPFNLGDLQKEAYRIFSFSPSYTLTIAEKLYLNALISYPRTYSQKLPSSINYRKIISGISRIDSTLGNKDRNNGFSPSKNSYPYTELAINLLSKHYLIPNEGSKTDSAHPAIYPTGEIPKSKLGITDLKLFNLIIRRFLATFGEPAISQDTTVTVLVKDDHIFNANGKKMIYEGWMKFYKPYIDKIRLGTQFHLPELHSGDIIKNVVVTMTEKFTVSAFRFNQASLLEKMEKEKIGTKATRSDIINMLFKRNYIHNATTAAWQKQDNRGGIEVTNIGFEIIQSVRKYIPTIASTDLTRSLEKQLEEIESGKTRSAFVINYGIAKLKEAIVPFKEKENEIGNQITEAVDITRNQQKIILGTCPICGKGDLQIIRSSITKKRFVGCSNYASDKCKARAPLPQKISIKTTGEICYLCRWPILEAVYARGAKHHWKFCINVHCQTKKNNCKRPYNNSESTH